MILYIDTTEKNFELRLYNKDGLLVDKFVSTSESNHSEELIKNIDALIIGNNISKTDISKITIVSGLGSYTGLRVGVATANAMAYALNIPIFGIKAEEKEALELAFASKLSSFDSPVEVYYNNPPHITASKK